MASPKPRGVSQGTARAFVFLAVFAIIAAAASGVLAVRAVQGEIRAKASVVQLCQAGNDSRNQQVTLWTHLIAVSVPPPRQTPAQKAARAKLITEFLGFVRADFAPRNCATSFKG